MGKIALIVHPIPERALDTAANGGIQLFNKCSVSGIFYIVLQLNNKARCAVGSVVIDVFRSQNVRDPPIIFRSFIPVLIFRKRQQNLPCRFKLAADQHCTGHCYKLVTPPILVEPRKSGINPLTLLPRHQLIHRQTDPVQSLSQLLIAAAQVNIILQKCRQTPDTLSF
ncbi:hypothetical protein D3C80_1224140 [compost metagenome]